MEDKPAFPRFYYSSDKDDQGMTLREYYAGCALQGLMANTTFSTLDDQLTARYAFLAADAMIASDS